MDNMRERTDAMLAQAKAEDKVKAIEAKAAPATADKDAGEHRDSGDPRVGGRAAVS